MNTNRPAHKLFHRAHRKAECAAVSSSPPRLKINPSAEGEGETGGVMRGTEELKRCLENRGKLGDVRGMPKKRMFKKSLLNK